LSEKGLVPKLRKPFAALAEGLSSGNWLPDSDALQNGNGLFYEFPFGILNGRKGHKQILLEDEYKELRVARVRPSRASLIQNARDRALQIKRRLESTPGLSRSALAKELGINRARVTQILRRFKD
jgi:hypothetical protein